MTKDVIAKKIIEKAMHYVGLFETESNAAWESIINPSKSNELSNELIKEMEKSGWKKGWPYCASLVETIWRQAYIDLNAPDDVIKNISTKLCPSVIKSYNGFKPLITKTPTPGSIFFMRKGKSSNGHAGIVCGVDGNKLATIEGNTSAGKALTAEADRNGDCITKKTRLLDFTVKPGLYLIGFLNPIEW